MLHRRSASSRPSVGLRDAPSSTALLSLDTIEPLPPAPASRTSLTPSAVPVGHPHPPSGGLAARNRPAAGASAAAAGFSAFVPSTARRPGSRGPAAHARAVASTAFAPAPGIDTRSLAPYQRRWTRPGSNGASLTAAPVSTSASLSVVASGASAGAGDGFTDAGHFGAASDYSTFSAATVLAAVAVAAPPTTAATRPRAASAAAGATAAGTRMRARGRSADPMSAGPVSAGPLASAGVEGRRPQSPPAPALEPLAAAAARAPVRARARVQQRIPAPAASPTARSAAAGAHVDGDSNAGDAGATTVVSATAAATAATAAAAARRAGSRLPVPPFAPRVVTGTCPGSADSSALISALGGAHVRLGKLPPPQPTQAPRVDGSAGMSLLPLAASAADAVAAARAPRLPARAAARSGTCFRRAGGVRSASAAASAAAAAAASAGDASAPMTAAERAHVRRLLGDRGAWTVVSELLADEADVNWDGPAGGGNERGDGCGSESEPDLGDDFLNARARAAVAQRREQAVRAAAAEAAARARVEQQRVADRAAAEALAAVGGIGALADRVARQEVPQAFICPITYELMRDPVILCDGHSYERAAIALWLQKQSVSPMTRRPLESTIFTPNLALRALITEWRTANPAV